MRRGLVFGLLLGLSTCCFFQSGTTAQVVSHAASTALSGTWLQDAATIKNPESPPLRIFIAQLGTDLVGINVDKQGFLPAGYPYIKGTSDSATSAKIELQGFSDRGLIKWYVGTMALDAPNHLVIGHNKILLHRIAAASSASSTCNPGSSAHVSGIEALAKGWLASHNKDDRAATCWFRLGAEAGDPAAEMWYASALIFGTGTAKNMAAAVPWVQKSAMQGNYGAALDLQHMFESGEGLPKSQQRAYYWGSRAELNDPAFVHTKNFLAVPQWATETAGPCQASNPAHLSAGAALSAGRVAYQARALDTAACWFQISAAAGNLKANLYLGLMHMFGLGVPTNATIGLAEVKKSAEANDGFALMYLANFYRLGIGTKADQNTATLLMQKALRAPNGFDAYTHVQGTHLNKEEAESAMVTLATSASAEDSCEGENEYQRRTYTNPKIRNCNQTADWFWKQATRPSKNTVQFVEEIFPEDFEFAVPNSFQILREAAKAGLTR